MLLQILHPLTNWYGLSLTQRLPCESRKEGYLQTIDSRVGNSFVTKYGSYVDFGSRWMSIPIIPNFFMHKHFIEKCSMEWFMILSRPPVMSVIRGFDDNVWGATNFLGALSMFPYHPLIPFCYFQSREAQGKATCSRESSHPRWLPHGTEKREQRKRKKETQQDGRESEKIAIKRVIHCFIKTYFWSIWSFPTPTPSSCKTGLACTHYNNPFSQLKRSLSGYCRREHSHNKVGSIDA